MPRPWDEFFIGLGSAPAPEGDQAESGGWMTRFRSSLKKSRSAFTQQLVSIAIDPSDEDLWEHIELGLIAADVGVPSTVEIVKQLEAKATAENITTSDGLAQGLRSVTAELMDNSVGASIDISQTPTVIMVVGVNGTGKTTTIGKVAQRLTSSGKSVVMGAADTFRAAATEQLAVWAERSGARFVGGVQGQDPASVAYDAVKTGVEENADVVIIDTAGRLHTKVNLMHELTKIKGVCEQLVPDAPHETLLVIDATTGQNGMRQADEFTKATGIDGVVVTKLDGTAKGGIAVAISNELGIPIKLCGIGEGIDDLQPFTADEFLEALFPDDLLASPSTV